ncbi:MAG: 6-bladed beta-propeller [Gammaproteobacteria bacterium]|nr:6-bladed beta-propeller [Gammaproteobacteria bacterium]
MTKSMGKLFWIIILAALLGGCAGKQYHFEHHATNVEMVWPKPPEQVRYRFVGFIAGETNFIEEKEKRSVIGKSFDWLGEFIFGESQPQVLFRPQGGFFDDANKRLYVTDIGRKAVFVFDFNENKLHLWEQADDFNKFNAPIAVAINDKNEVFVSDSAQGFVFRFDADGHFISKLGEGVLQRPTGLAFNKATKQMFVADSAAHKVYAFNEQGKVDFVIGDRRSSKDGLFNSPTYLTIAHEKLLVVDTLNSRVQLFDLNGKWLQSFGKRGMFIGDMPRPKGVAVDSQGNIYVVESYYNHLLIFNGKGEPLMPIGGQGSKAGQFDLPAGVWIDGKDRVYVADMFNSRISVFQYLHDSSTKQ